MDRNVTASAERIASRFRRNLEDCVRIDARSLAVFRVFVGLLIVADVLLRSRNFTYFYAEDGAVPRSLVMQYAGDAFSVYHYTTDPTVIAALLALQVLFAVQLIVGYRTRLATVISFLFVVSLDYQNPFVLSYADTLFRLLLFWAIFLPLGERWSVDAVRRDRTVRSSFAGLASALILGQMVFMYFLNWYHKSQDEHWTGGDATPLIMGLDDTTYLLAGYLRQFPALLELGTHLWYYMLMFSWLLILLVGRKRLFLVGLFVGGHASFIATVRIGAFPYVAIAGLTLFLQAQFWDDLRLIATRLGIDDEPYRRVRERLASVAATVPSPQLNEPTVEQVRAGAYNLSLGVVFVSLVVFSAFTYVPIGGVADTAAGPSEQAHDHAATLGVDQPEWSVFAPTPRTTDRYYVFPAVTEDGERVDAYNERELTFERPHDELQKQYDTYRERFYMNSIRSGGFDDEPVTRYLAEHICETWSEEHGQELTHVNMYAVYEDVTMDTIDDHEDREKRSSRFYRHGCGDNEPRTIERPDF